jgi:N-acetylmuramoyl-L-alanine amidase
MGVITYKEGSKGAVVTLIQKAVGCYPDGIWGKLTTEAVKNYQKEHGLTADGIAGPKTLLAMGIDTKGSGTSVSLDSVVSSYGGKTIRLKRSKRRIDYIVIHCTATQEGRDMTVEDIRRQHKAQGWSDCGYHYIIYRDGTVNIGRDVDISGAHVSGYNSNSIGISYVGGLESRPSVPYSMLKAKDTRTDAQKASLLSLLMDLRKLYPKAKIQGHRDFSPDKNHDGVISPDEWVKECPSFDAKFAYRNV